MATNPTPRTLPGGDAWVATLQTPAPERLIWCDECHYFHREINECAYVTPRVGA